MADIFKDNFRAVLCGPSNCGKSYLLSSIMTDPKYNLVKTKDNPDGIYEINRIFVFSPTCEIDDSQ